MIAFYPAGPREKEALERRVKIITRILYGFLALVILFFIAMALPFSGLDTWFWLSLVFCGIMFLLFQGIIHYVRSKFNRYLSEDRLCYCEGVVTAKLGKLEQVENPTYGIALDGEEMTVDAYDHGRLSVGDRYALLKWDQQDLRIESAVGDAAIAELKLRRNLG